jgi:hypothetical protein
MEINPDFNYMLYSATAEDNVYRKNKYQTVYIHGLCCNLPKTAGKNVNE